MHFALPSQHFRRTVFHRRLLAEQRSECVRKATEYIFDSVAETTAHTADIPTDNSTRTSAGPDFSKDKGEEITQEIRSIITDR